MSEIVLGSRRFKKYCEVTSTIIDKIRLYDCFTKRFKELIERVNFNFNFTDPLFLNYGLQFFKNELCVTNVLAHLLFCCRSPNSNESQCRFCSRLYVKNANNFVSSIKYHFPLIFTNDKNFNNEIVLLFAKSRRTRFNLDVLYSSNSHFQLVHSKQNCCMYFLVVKQPCDIVVYLSEVYVRILTNQIVSISNDLLSMSGEQNLSTIRDKCDMFVDSSVESICSFYFDMCKLLRPETFVYMYDNFVPNVDHSAETFKIINKSYLEYYLKKFNK